MKQINFRSFLIMCLFAWGVGFSSCKNKAKDTTRDSDSVTSVTPGTVEVSPDETLTKDVQDATKDYPGVQATVTNGEVTLAGTIERDRLPKLMESIQSLHPKKVNNLLELK